MKLNEFTLMWCTWIHCVPNLGLLSWQNIKDMPWKQKQTNKNKQTNKQTKTKQNKNKQNKKVFTLYNGKHK